MMKSTTNTENLKLDAKKDLLARLDRAVELALDLQRIVNNMTASLEAAHPTQLAA